MNKFMCLLLSLALSACQSTPRTVSPGDPPLPMVGRTAHIGPVPMIRTDDYLRTVKGTRTYADISTAIQYNTLWDRTEDLPPTEGCACTFHEIYEHASKGGLVLTSELFIARSTDAANRFEEQTFAGTRVGLVRKGYDVHELPGSESWTPNGHYMMVSANGLPPGNVLMIRHDLNIVVVTLFAAQPLSDEKSVHALFEANLPAMLTFDPKGAGP
jgi:hypothetical protein